MWEEFHKRAQELIGSDPNSHARHWLALAVGFVLGVGGMLVGLMLFA